ncbi:uncharacterized protein LOC107212476 isoform X1 [Parus major]|uniref:uncharacterized protein LOC107212476 isoform X1 n=1 Tax=Parus major TaxID=9157 RepID=UPI0007711DB8|nr:uncharacterized protein LOC107212476 isoform X1 [Parus major]
MATLTLGTMLDVALGSSRAGAVDFEQLYNLLNGMLLHLGLRDLPVQENGEPLEGAEGSPFSAAFLEELMRKVEANEKELAEVRARCQQLNEEVTEMKVEQSRMTEDMQRMKENFGVDSLDDLRNQLLESVMSAVRDMLMGDQDSPEPRSRQINPLDDDELIVIGNEITLVERTPVPRPISPLPPKAETEDREKDSLEATTSSHPVSFGADEVGQIKDEEIKISISEAEALPSHLDVPPEMSDVGEIKDEEIEMSISKKKSLDDRLTTSRMHPGAPGTHPPVQRVQALRGTPGSQTPWIPGESVAGTSSKLLTPKEERGGGSSRMESLQAKPGMMMLKVPSSKYSPCEPLVRLRSEIPSTPPLSPGLSARLCHARKQYQTQEQREQAAEGYSRRSPMYCGGKHTSTYPVQPMEPLLPDPNKPGVIELMGKDGLVYRGRDT